MKHWRPVAFSVLLFALNAYICRELFAVGFIHNLATNEGSFVALSRFFREHPVDFRWFPWFNTGMPIENAYQPLLPVLAALTGAVANWPVERAFHFILALAYCAGPAALFWFAWDWSQSLALSAIAGSAWTLLSPGAFLIPILRVTSNGHWQALRIYNLLHYAEDPHTLALALLPLALLFLRRAASRSTPWDLPAVVLSCAAVVLSNMFGAVDLAVGGICIVLALRGRWSTLLIAGVLSWMLISPWLPPSLIDHIRNDQGVRDLPSMTIALAAFAVLWILTRSLRNSFERFTILFAACMCAIPLSFFWSNINLVPQPNRYQLEMEMALSLAIGCVCMRLPWRPLFLAVLILIGIRQTIVFRRAARGLIWPIDITSTIEYKSTKWIDRNLPGRRVMLAGDPQFLFNVLSNNPQMSASHDPTAPNWMQRVAVYVISTGDGAGAGDAQISTFWLKAFGNAAIYVPGPNSREFYHPIAHPRKFDGVLPVLWHEEDDTIYAVPQRSPSRAHVIPKEAIAVKKPIHGVDLEPARAYVAALEDPSLPLADLKWIGPSRASIHASLKAGQVISVQETYAPGWRASTSKAPAKVHADALGLMVIEPDCNGNCDIDLRFGVSTEAWICRALSALAALFLVALFPNAKGRKNPIQNFVGIHRSGNGS